MNGRRLNDVSSDEQYKVDFCLSTNKGKSKDDLFHCYLENQVKFAQEERCDDRYTDPTQKFRCYLDNNVPKNVKYCDAVYALNTKHTKKDELKQCYKDAGFAVFDKNFCDS